jgi:thioredoxin-related protein
MNKLVKIGSMMALFLAVIGTSSFKPIQKKTADIPGIKFFHGTMAEAKAKAKKENKLIFIDCYTTWCGPCKSMAKKTFTNKEVGDYYNKNFICVKMDMESGEGPKLQSTYSVEAYPTFLFINSKGEVKHRELGYIDAVRFIEVGKIALSK